MKRLLAKRRPGPVAWTAAMALAVLLAVEVPDVAPLVAAFVLYVTSMFVVLRAGRALPALHRGGGLAELLSTPTPVTEVVDDLAAEGARLGLRAALWLALPMSLALWLFGALSAEGAAFLVVGSSLVLPLFEATTMMILAESLPGLPRPHVSWMVRVYRVLAGFSLAAFGLAQILGAPEFLFLLLAAPPAALLVRAGAIARLHAWSVTGAPPPPSRPRLARGWKLRFHLEPTRADVLRSVATGGSALLGRPAMAILPALLIAGVACFAIVANPFQGYHHPGSLTLCALLAVGLGAVGFSRVAAEVRRDWEGATIQALWSTGLGAASATDGWAALWAVPGSVAGLAAAPFLLAYGLHDGLPLLAACFVAVLPALTAPLAGYAGAWAGAAGERQLWTRGLATLLILSIAVGAAVGGLWLLVDDPPSQVGAVLMVLSVLALIAGAVGARNAAKRDLAQADGRPGFS